MAKNMVFLVHKTNNSVIYTNSKSDLATILGVSLRTIIRNYSNVGMYESMHYIIYVGVEKYDNGKEYNYNHIVEPPKPKLYDDNKSHTMTDKVDNMAHSNRDIEHVEPIEEEPIETDWREVEKNLLFNEMRSYYSKRTYEQLHDSYDYFINRPNSQFRISIINEFAKIRQLE